MANIFVLVTGTMRSGTSLMAELLYSSAYARPTHPRLSFVTDTYDTIRKFLYRAREQEQPGMGIGHPYGTLEVEESKLREVLENTEGESFTGSLVDELRCQLLSRAPVPLEPLCIGNKATNLSVEFDILRRLFGRARVIVMVRDPRDVFASNLVRVGDERALDGLTVLASIANLNVFLRERKNDPDLMVVKYEDLVRAAGPVIQRILHFVELDEEHYDWAALERGEIASNSSYAAHRGTGFPRGQGISIGSIGQFRTRLNPFQLYAVERLLGPHMAEFGYQPEGIPDREHERVYLSQFLPGLIGQSKRAGFSLEGLRCMLETDGLGDCVDDIVQRLSLGPLLVKGDRPAWSEFQNRLSECRSAERVMVDLKAALGQRAWPDLERLIGELVSGEQNAERLSRMVVTVAGQLASSDEALDYIQWSLAQKPRHWRWLHTRRLSLLAADATTAERAIALADLITNFDAHLVQHPDDVIARLIKVENVHRYGTDSDRMALAADLDALEEGISDRQLTVAQSERISAALNRAGRSGKQNHTSKASSTKNLGGTNRSL